VLAHVERGEVVHLQVPVEHPAVGELGDAPAGSDPSIWRDRRVVDAVGHRAATVFEMPPLVRAARAR
jgi:hypothetical protein